MLCSCFTFISYNDALEAIYFSSLVVQMDIGSYSLCRSCTAGFWCSTPRLETLVLNLILTIVKNPLEDLSVEAFFVGRYYSKSIKSRVFHVT